MNGCRKINEDTKKAIEREAVPAHRTDGYDSQAAPTFGAAKFNQAARDIMEIKQAIDPRCDLPSRLSDPGRPSWKLQWPNS